MSRRLLSLYVAALVAVLTGCSFLGGNSARSRVATPVSPGSATATAQIAVANERLQGSLDQLRTSVALLPDRDALRIRVAAIEASLRRVEAGGTTARAAAAAHRCGDLVAQVEVVRGAVDAAHAGLAGLEESFAATGTLASDALTAAASTQVALESVYRAVVGSLFSANPGYDARAVLAELAKAEPTVGNHRRRAAGAASTPGARAQAARRHATVVAGLEKSCRSGQGMPAAVALPSPPVFAPPPVVAPPTPSAGAVSAPRAPASGPPVRATRDTTPMSGVSKPKPKRTPLRKDVGNETSEAQPIPHDPPRIDPPQPPEPPDANSGTSAPDANSGTSAPDANSGTSAPDANSGTSAPDANSGTSAPDANSGGESTHLSGSSSH